VLLSLSSILTTILSFLGKVVQPLLLFLGGKSYAEGKAAKKEVKDAAKDREIDEEVDGLSRDDLIDKLRRDSK
jgi:Mn2+/Fe2+ NRAMP family transporter